jgi:hypothetical protein
MSTQGRFDAADFAIFQCNPLRSTQALNEADLRDELRLLNSAQFFLDSFYKRAKAFKVRNLPGMFAILYHRIRTSILLQLSGGMLQMHS